MKLKIEIKTDNAAFEDCPGMEIASILNQVIESLGDGVINTGDGANLFDSNGNTVGSWEIKE